MEIVPSLFHLKISARSNHTIPSIANIYVLQDYIYTYVHIQYMDNYLEDGRIEAATVRVC